MKVKAIVDEDFVNYKKPSMFIAMPYCTFKCEEESGCDCCQNSPLTKLPDVDINIDKLVERYQANSITQAIVFGGLEPFESFGDLYKCIKKFREVTDNDIVIYTGFNKYEILDKLFELSEFDNIIIKYGRYIPNSNSKYDELLGVVLASENQYAERVFKRKVLNI